MTIFIRIRIRIRNAKSLLERFYIRFILQSFAYIVNLQCYQC